MGYGLGVSLQQDTGVPTVAFDLCFKTQQPFTHPQGIDRDGLGVRVHHYRLSLAALSITLLTLRLRRL